MPFFASAENKEIVGKELEVRVSDEGFIQGLKYSTPVIATNGVGDTLRNFVLVRGLYDRPEWQLSAEGPDWKRNIKISRRGTFVLQVPITSEVINLRFEAKGPDGQTESETLLVQTSKLELVVLHDNLKINDYVLKITPFVALYNVDAIDNSRNSGASFHSNFEPGAMLSIRLLPNSNVCPYIRGKIYNICVVPSGTSQFDTSSLLLWRGGLGITSRVKRTSRFSVSFGAAYAREFIIRGKTESVLTLTPADLLEIDLGTALELLEETTYALFLEVELKFPISRIIEGISIRNGFEIDGGLTYVNRFTKGALGISQLHLSPFVTKGQLNASILNQDVTSFGLRLSLGW